MMRYFYLFTIIVFIPVISGCDTANDYVIAGDQAESQRNYADAANWYTSAIAENPNNGKVYNFRAKDYALQGKYEQAFADYTKAIELDPANNAYYYNQRAVYVYDRQGKLTQEISDLTKAIELNPRFAVAYYNRGYTYQEQGNLPQAIRDYSKAIAIAPNDTDPVTRLREIMNNYAVAFADFQQKAAIWRALPQKPPLPEEVRRFRVLGDDALENKRFSEAANYYEQGLAIDPMWPSGQFNAAIIYAELKSYSFAVIHMKRYLALNPDTKDAKSYQDKMYIWQEKANKNE